MGRRGVEIAPLLSCEVAGEYRARPSGLYKRWRATLAHTHIRRNPGVCCGKSGTGARTTIAPHWHYPSLLTGGTNVARRRTG
jgi:hypothetical protein